MPPAAKKSSPTKLNTAKSKAPTARPGDTTPKGTPRKTAKSKGTGKTGKDKLQGIEEEISAAPAAAQKAAEKAGYSTKVSRESARVSASRTLRLPKVQRYMMECVSRTIGLGAVTASNKLVQLSNDAKSEYVQLEASKDILDRVGLRTPDRVNHQVVGDIKVSIDLS